ncbi:MAG: TonB family protein [Gammaproteobacteria bacterium]|nr:TonB family protein [Gammaproteobacteria bacterium]
MSPASVRHRVWVGSLLCLALLPVLSWFVPIWTLPVLNNQRGQELIAAYSLPGVLLTIYIVVAVLRGSLLCLEILRIARISAAAEEGGSDWRGLITPQLQSSRLRIKLSRDVDSPVTWGVLNPVVLLPATAVDWTSADRRMVMNHEISHIVRGDWLAQLLAQWVCILYWPLPGIGRVLDRLSLEAEQACDDCVLAAGACAPEYAALLVSQARLTGLPATVALGRPSELGRRVRNMVTGISDHSSELNQRRWMLPLCTLLMVPLASLHLVPVQPSDDTGLLSRRVFSFNLPAADPVASSGQSWHKPVPPTAVQAVPVRSPLTEVIFSEMYETLPESVDVASPVVEFELLPVGTANAQPTHRVLPVYPRRAIRRGLEGDVVVQFTVNRSGQVKAPRILAAFPPDVFEQAVMEAVSQQRYRWLGGTGGSTEPEIVTQIFKFRLDGDRKESKPTIPPP